MIEQYPQTLGFVQHLAPTWRKTQHRNLAQLLTAILDRPTLCLSQLARSMPKSDQPLHGRLKRLMRFLENPRLDEAALFVRWLKLSYRFGDEVPQVDDERPILPLLLDTTYFDPFAALVASVPCGSRGLPVALTTYHRSKLKACFPPVGSWPKANEQIHHPRPIRGQKGNPASSAVKRFLSQNHIEEHLIDYLFTMVSPALHPVLVADRGFARADLFRHLQAKKRDYVIRIDAQTHISLPEPLSPDLPKCGVPESVLGLGEGTSVWCPVAWYGKEDRVPIRLLGLWDKGYKEPWYLATTGLDANQTELLYRWRMRIECANRDEKSGVLLRESGDNHALTNILHLHRLLLALCLAEWLCGLTGLQAWHDLPTKQDQDLQPTLEYAANSAVSNPLSEPTKDLIIRPKHSPSRIIISPDWVNDSCILREGPASPPPVIPHRGKAPKLPSWMRPFAARGMLSYVRLGLEVLRSKELLPILRNLVSWLAAYLWTWTPMWYPHQVRYRLTHWWIDSS